MLLFVAYVQWKKRVSRNIGDASLLRLLIPGPDHGYANRGFIVLMLSFACGVLAAMNLRRSGENLSVSKKGIDIVVALDLSKSMLATDLVPNRLERAKQFVGKLLDAMPDDRVALVVFAAKAYLQMPFTSDHGAAQLFLASASPDLLPQQGTDISDALRMSTRAFAASSGQLKSVVLITDGEDHERGATETARELSKQGVVIHVVGVGSSEGSTIPDPLTGGMKKDEAGNTIVSRLDESFLQKLADATKGVYLRLQNSEEAVKQLKNQLASIDRKQITDQSRLSYRSFYMWFAAGMLLLLLTELFIPERKKRILA